MQFPLPNNPIQKPVLQQIYKEKASNEQIQDQEIIDLPSDLSPQF